MKYKKLPGVNEEVSALSIGTWAMGGANSAGGNYGEVDEQESIRAIHTLIDKGVNMVDLAPIYGEGEAEKLVGKALKGYRDKMLVVTKYGSYMNHFTGTSERNCKYNSIIRECDESLSRIGLDYIDFYLMHWPDTNTSIEESMAAINELKKQGKIRYSGFSNATSEMIEEAEKYTPVSIVQSQFSMVNRSNQQFMEELYSKNIGNMTYGSLGAGILTGTIRELPKFDEKDFRLTFYPFFKEPMFSNVMKLLESMDELSKKYNKTLAQIALNWSTQQSFLTTAICGIRNEEEAIENISAFDWTMSNDDQNYLSQLLDELNIK